MSFFNGGSVRSLMRRSRRFHVQLPGLLNPAPSTLKKRPQPSEAFLAWSWTLSPWGFVPLAGRLPLAYIPVPLLLRPQLGAFANGEERRGNLGRRDADAEARG